MNAPLTILVAAGCSLAVTAGASLFGTTRSAEKPDAELRALLADLSQRVEGLRADQTLVKDELAALRLQQPAAGGQRYAEGEVEAAIARYLAEHAAPAAAAGQKADLAASEVKSVDLRTLVDALTDDESDWMERE